MLYSILIGIVLAGIFIILSYLFGAFLGQILTGKPLEMIGWENKQERKSTLTTTAVVIVITGVALYGVFSTDTSDWQLWITAASGIVSLVILIVVSIGLQKMFGVWDS